MQYVQYCNFFLSRGQLDRWESIPHLERVLVVLAALSAVEPGEVVVDPRLGGARHVGHVGLQAPQLDLRLQRVRVAPGRAAYPILESQSRNLMGWWE